MKIKGLDKALTELKAINAKTKGGVIRALDLVGLRALDAMDNVPVDMGKLRQGNGKRVDKDSLKLALFNNVPYAPFVEFGTGARVQVPNELKELAGQFKGQKSGSFDDFLDQIRDWCKRHGIDEKAAYPIAMSILKKGLQPKPFLYPAYLLGKKEFLNQIQLLVKTLK